jgi:hypothetical protein
MDLRTAATSVFVFILLAMASALISANVRKLADKHGWDNFLIRWTQQLRWERLRGLWWLWSIFGLSGGVALAVWLLPFVQPNHEPSDLTQQLDKIKQERDSKSNELERDSKSNELWDVLAIVQNKDGTNLRLEVDKAKNLQECKNRAMVAYAHLPNGPIFCQHVTHVELIDVYGNARPVQ